MDLSKQNNKYTKVCLYEYMYMYIKI